MVSSLRPVPSPIPSLTRNRHRRLTSASMYIEGCAWRPGLVLPTTTTPLLKLQLQRSHSKKVSRPVVTTLSDDSGLNLSVTQKKTTWQYMLDSATKEELINAAGVKDGDFVLEIGPGTGSLTNLLIDAGATVLAIEKDPHMAVLVREQFENISRLKKDVGFARGLFKCHIRHHMHSLLQEGSMSNANPSYAKVVADIPFNISTNIVKQLLLMGDIFSQVVLLLQEETALCLVESSSKSSEYRPINVFINFYSNPQYKFKVPRTNFFSQPNVDAAIVAFKLKQAWIIYQYPPLIASSQCVLCSVNSAFSGKRKMLRKSLQHLLSSFEIEKALEKIDLPNMRTSNGKTACQRQIDLGPVPELPRSELNSTKDNGPP
ncbi:Ribosomal RNA adenine methyltransferase KsgA/Erm [Dillenia turbinata]|uniref:rRNA adenine N(6)-methyltransferase n=1 Tax=Dillenia turbinata TaxID=194707 RepID=A0AAN8Z2L5_9MAGN